MINHLAYEKAIILNKNHKQKYMQDDIIQENYTYVFTSLEIVFQKKGF